jgi:hypothetical protein
MPETLYLSDARSPLRIECSRSAMEQIRRRAREGLMAAPRVGMGVGGLLLGVRKGARIRLLDSIDIPCSHSIGPSFDLAPDERRESLAMIAEAGEPGVSRKVGVIGWYCSKTRGDATLNQSDLSLYDELFPNPWQIALVVRPNVVEAMHATFFFRDENGAIIKGVECDVDEWRLPPRVESESVEPEPGELSAAPERVEDMPVKAPEVLFKQTVPKVVEISTPAPKLVETPLLAQPARRAETRLSDIIDLTSHDTGADTRSVASQIPVRPPASPFVASGFKTPQLRQRGKLHLVLQIAASLVAAGLGAFFARDYWMPKPPLTLNSTESNGTLLIRWNPDALRGVDHASMFVNDGGQPAPSLIPLDRFQLNSGVLSYTPKSRRVTAKLDAGETTAITAWFAPPPADRQSPPNDGKANK